jgi:hypothetical protein
VTVFELGIGALPETALGDGKSPLELGANRRAVAVGVPVTSGRHHRPDQRGGDHLRLEVVGRLT